MLSRNVTLIVMLLLVSCTKVESESGKVIIEKNREFAGEFGEMEIKFSASDDALYCVSKEHMDYVTDFYTGKSNMVFEDRATNYIHGFDINRPIYLIDKQGYSLFVPDSDKSPNFYVPYYLCSDYFADRNDVESKKKKAWID